MHEVIREIRKRNGKLVPFEREKIHIAIQKAFFAVTGDAHNDEAEAITSSVVGELEGLFAKSEVAPSVEDIQDRVELAVMERGFFDVAKAYIIYRFEHEQDRKEEQEELQQKIERSELFVTKRDGNREAFSVEKIQKSIERAAGEYIDDIQVEELLRQCRDEVYDGMTTEDVAQTLVLIARSFIERDPAYSYLASRLLLHTVIYRDALGRYKISDESIEDAYRNSFKQYVHDAVKLGLLDARMTDFDFSKLCKAIDPSRDNLLRYLGTQTLNDRYFIKDKREKETHRTLETPQYLWMRVAMGLSLFEENKEERAIEFYDVLSKLYFVSSSPTLFFSGTKYSQLSSCYLNVVEDNLESIFKTFADNAHLSKHAAGIGTSWSKIRATGALVKSTNIESNGVIPFLKIADSTTVAISRSGRRRGATCVYLETWHYDIEDFLELRKNTGDDRRRTHDMNTANWIPDLFMKRVRDDGPWTLFSPDEVSDLTELYGSAFEKRYEEYEGMAERGEIHVYKVIQARSLWKKMVTMLFETGHPWITFKDPSNIRSPQDHVGVVHNSNLCTEITLNTSQEETAVCNLGSVNLSKHVNENGFDMPMIKKTVTTAMRMLDNVIDINYYPIPEAKTSNMRHRPVGLGVMGFQDALYMLGVNFNSDECVRLADTSMEAISYYAILASSKLAEERGAYESFAGSKWDRGLLPIDTLDLLAEERGEEVPVDRSSTLDWNIVRSSIKKHGMRNSNCLALAPTATISNIAGCLPTIEPIYKNIYVKSNISGHFTVMNTYLVDDLKKAGLWSSEMLELIKGQEGSLARISAIPDAIKSKYREVFEIDAMHLVKVAAHRGKWLDQSQSLNIFFSGTSGSVLSNVYLYAWQMGLKTTYYLRTLGASAIEQSTVSLGRQNKITDVTDEAREAAEVAVKKVKATVLAGGGGDSEPKLCKIEDPDCEACQ